MPSSATLPGMNPLQLQRLGLLAGSLLLAMLMAWAGLAYQGRSGAGGNPASPASPGTGLQLRQVSTLLLEAHQRSAAPARPADLLARTDWTAQSLPLSFGWTDKVLWTRLRLENTGDTARDVWLEVAPPRLTFVRLHEPTAAGAWRVQTSGVVVAAASRPVEIPELVFPLRLLAGEQREVLLEVRSGSTAMNLTFMLHDPLTFVGVSARTNLWDLLLIGGTLTLGTLSLCIGLAQGQGVQLLLGLRSLMIGVWLLLQLGFVALLLPDAAVAWLGSNTAWIASITLMLTTAFVWMFLSRASPQGLPRAVHRCFAVLLVLPLASELLALAGLRDPSWLGPFLAVGAASMLVFTLPVSAMLIWKGHLSAATILVTSLGALLLNSPYYLAIWGISRSELVRQFISPIPVLITSAVFFIGTTLQLARERRASLAIRLREQGEAMARLEGMVAERTLSLQDARDDAQRANAAKSVFMAKVSHELRTPLHTVLGYLNLALRDQPPAPVVRKLEVSRRAGEQLVAHIDGLLDFARMEHDQLALVKAPWHLDDLLVRVGERTRLLAEEHGNHFVTALAPPPAAPISELLGDALRLEQVLMILLSNAMRYTRHGSVTLQVSAAPGPEARGPGATLRFVVADTGRGITPEALARIFTLFERGDSADRGGLGLGLPIAQQLLALMDSRLDVTSQPGAGSRFGFTVWQPLAATDAPQATVPDVALPARAYQGSCRRVLVLDDLPEGRQYLQELLHGLGFQVTAVASVDEAVAASQRSAAWDLCIVDQQLADGATGWAFVEWLQNTPTQAAGLQTCPVLMLSATSAQPPAGLVLARGVDQHLIKPASDTALMSALAALMGLQWQPAARVHAAQANLALASDRPAVDWAALQACAAQGDITGLHRWVQGQSDLAAHPVLDRLIERLDFAGMSRYAADRVSGAGGDNGADGVMPAQVR